MPKRISEMEKREIIRRLRAGNSIRAINRETGLARETIRDIKDLSESKGWLKPEQKLPDEKEIASLIKPPVSNLHVLDSIKDKIKSWLNDKCSYVVIQRLAESHDIKVSVSTITRYVKKHFPKIKKISIRREFAPGESAEVDFGFMGLVFDEKEKRNRKGWFFSLRLNYSRKAYRQIVFDQKAETFFRCHIHAFEHFGGVPRKIICDNLKAAVIKACIQDPKVNRAYLMLAEHYDYLISPCAPRKPEHKGGVEKDIDYIKRNFLPFFLVKQKEIGRSIPYFSDAVKSLAEWSKNNADERKVKFVGQKPREMFEEEKEHLKSLPFERWDIVRWFEPKVGDDWRIHVNGSFYSVPYKYRGERVRAYLNSRELVVFHEYEQIARHKAAKRPNERVVNPDHGPPNYQEYLETTSQGVLYWAKGIGKSTHAFVEKLLNQRGVDGLRAARGVCGLTKKYGLIRVEKACCRALYYNLKGLSNIKNILEENLDQLELGQLAENVFQLDFNSAVKSDFKFSRKGQEYNF